MSHWQVKDESASASRVQKHEITCMKTLSWFWKCSREWKCFMKVQELSGNWHMDNQYNNQLEGNLLHSFHDRKTMFYL